MRVVIVGAGALGWELYDWLYEARQLAPATIFVDDVLHDEPISERHGRVYCTVDEYEPTGADAIYVAIGHPGNRQRVVERLQQKRLRPWQICPFIHPTAKVVRSASIGPGCLILPYAIVSSNALLQEHVLINTHSAIGHDVTVGAFTSIYSHVAVGGNCQIGGSVEIGSGAVLIPNRTVGYGAKVGAGTAVYRDVPPEHTAYGSPAKHMRLP